jgi:hypothetical protein
MSIHEQITALLDGELAEPAAVGELMHVLAVSPEKQALLVEQLSLKRRFANAASRIVPPASGDLAIMRGLGAVDAELAATTPAPDATPAPMPVAGASAPMARYLLGAVSLLLLIGSFGAGYYFRGDGSTTVAGRVAPTIVRVGSAELAGARDSIALLQKQVAAIAASSAEKPGVVTTIRSAPARSRAQAVAPSASIIDAALDIDQPGTRSGSDHVTRTMLKSRDREPLDVAAPASDRSSRGNAAHDETPIASLVDINEPLGVQLGFRNYMRLSLPRVYGLAASTTILHDREVVASAELGSDGDGLLARLRAGAAFGQTQFSQVVHTNTGGEAVDTVNEQSPVPFYARAFVAPELVRFEQVTGLLEVGGGYSGSGPFNTVGFNVEYRPFGELALHAGASTWVLWSEYNGALNLSTNLSAHLGFMYGF